MTGADCTPGREPRSVAASYTNDNDTNVRDFGSGCYSQPSRQLVFWHRRAI